MRLSVNILIIIFAIISWYTGFLAEYLLTLIFIFAHEAGHVTTALLAGAKVYTLRILPVGLNAEIDDSSCSRSRRTLIYAAGPGLSFLLAFFFYITTFTNFDNELVAMGYNVNLYLGMFNLLPVLPLDGGKIVLEFLSGKMGVIRTGKVLQFISLFVAIAIVSIGLISLIYSKGSISLLIIGIYIIMCSRTNKEETAFMNIKSLLFRKSRVMRKGIYPVREIVVLKTVKLSDVIKAMDYIDRFHIINVLDDNMRVIKVMTEQELLDAIVQNTPDTKFENLVDIEYNVHNEVN